MRALNTEKGVEEPGHRMPGRAPIRLEGAEWTGRFPAARRAVGGQKASSA